MHESGEVSDGSAIWRHLHDGAGVVRIIDVLSPTSATVNLVSTMPDGIGAGTAYWSEGAYSDARGWPSTPPAVREERLVVGCLLYTSDAADE